MEFSIIRRHFWLSSLSLTSDNWVSCACTFSTVHIDLPQKLEPKAPVWCYLGFFKRDLFLATIIWNRRHPPELLFLMTQTGRSILQKHMLNNSSLFSQKRSPLRMLFPDFPRLLKTFWTWWHCRLQDRPGTDGSLPSSRILVPRPSSLRVSGRMLKKVGKPLETPSSQSGGPV